MNPEVKKLRWRAAGVLATVVGANLLTVDRPARLGLQGGTQMVLETRAVVPEPGDGNVAIRTTQLDPGEADATRSAVEATAGEPTVVRDEFVGPIIGQELRRKVLTALAPALAAQLVYLAVRFRWAYAAGAVTAMPTTCSCCSASSHGSAGPSTASSSQRSSR